MGAAGVMRRIAVLLAAAGLCAVIGGCASDVGAMTSKSGSSHLRYYGGPKYPMWPSPQ
jgi:hypothetical protein